MKAYISIILAGVVFGFVGTMVKLIGNSIPTMTITFFRALIGMLFLLALLPFFDRNMFRINRTDLRNYIILGILMALNFFFFIAANTVAPVSNVIILFCTFPFWLAIISPVFLKERITKFIILCIVIAFVGVAIINPFQGIANIGNIFALLNGVNYAVIYAFMRYIDKTHTIGVVFWFMLFATIVLLPAPFLYGLGTVSWNYLWVLLMGAASTGLAYLFLNYGLEKIQAETTSIISITTEPVVAILAAILVLGETLTPNVLVGGIMIIGTGVMLEKKYKLTRK